VTVVALVAWAGILCVPAPANPAPSPSSSLLGPPLGPMTAPLAVTATQTNESWPNGCGNFPALVQFQSTVSGGTPPYTYLWSFGDGSPNSSQPNPDHSYAAMGPWSVTFRATDSVGEQAHSNFSFTIVPPPCPPRYQPFGGGPGLLVFAVLLVAIVAIVIGVELYRRRRPREK
jgi:hypothetical protein